MEHFNFEDFKTILNEPRFFVLRTNGEACYPKLKEKFSMIKEEEVLKILIPLGIVIDYSFADETIGRLYQEIWNSTIKNRYVIVKVSHSDQFANIRASIRMRELLAMVIDHQDNIVLVGQQDKKDAVMEETMIKLNINKTLTAVQFSEQNELALSTAGMRLKRLFEAHLAKRAPDKEDPRLFVYSSLLD
jgi:hypothetical protein